MNAQRWAELVHGRYGYPKAEIKLHDLEDGSVVKLIDEDVDAFLCTRKKPVRGAPIGGTLYD